MLDAHILVLNRSWVAVHIASVRRALSLLYQDHARVVHTEDYALYNFEQWCELSHPDNSPKNGHEYIHTPSFRIRQPEVIVLRTYNGFIRRDVCFSRRNIFVRDKHKCQYCGKRLSKQDLSIDHIVPRSRGGQDTWKNLVLACMPCNVKKGNRTPEEASMRLLSAPAAPKWLPQFGAKITKEEIPSWQPFMEKAY